MKLLRRFLSHLFLLGCGLLFFFSSIKSTNWTPVDLCQDYFAVQRLLQHETIYEPLDCLIEPTYASVQYDAHPPFSLFLYLPFALFNLNKAMYLWSYFSFVLYFAAGILLLKANKIYSLPAVLIFTLSSIFWEPVIAANSVHNLIQHILFLCALSFYWFQKDKLHLSGVALGLAALIKLYPLGIIFIALLCKQKKLFWSSLITYGLGSLLAFLIVGPKEHFLYLTQVIPHEKFFYPDPGLASIPAVITRLLVGFHFYNLAPLFSGISLEMAVGVGSAVGVVLLFIGIIWLWRFSKITRHHKDSFIIFGLAPILLHLTFPISWMWSTLIFLLPITMLLPYYKKLLQLPSGWLILGMISSLGVIFPDWRFPFNILAISEGNYIFNTILSTWFTLAQTLFFVFLVYCFVWIGKTKSYSSD